MNAPMRKRLFRLAFHAWDGLGSVLWNALALVCLLAFLLPLISMLITSVKADPQFNYYNPPAMPVRMETWDYEGTRYPLYYVPTTDGQKVYAMVNGFPRYCDFMDPQDPARGVFRIQTSRYQFQPVYSAYITLENFTELFAIPEFQAALWNTAKIALLGISASVISSVLIAYGFSRFPVPFGRALFILLIGTIMLPDKVTLVPNIAMFFLYLNWDGTYLPLIVPYLFGNAVMIFLLHQNFRRIPKEQEEAAMLDGAGVTRILWDIILPQSIPVIATVILLQFFFFWNDLGGPTLYLSLAPDLQPVSFWLQQDLAFGAHPPNALQARALVSMIVPAVALVLSQRFFMQGIRITGVEK